MTKHRRIHHLRPTRSDSTENRTRSIHDPALGDTSSRRSPGPKPRWSPSQEGQPTKESTMSPRSDFPLASNPDPIIPGTRCVLSAADDVVMEAGMEFADSIQDIASDLTQALYELQMSYPDGQTYDGTPALVAYAEVARLSNELREFCASVMPAPRSATGNLQPSAQEVAP